MACCKLKVTIGHGRVQIDALKPDNTTVDYTVADIPLIGSTSIKENPDREEVTFYPAVGEPYTLRFQAVQLPIADPYGISLYTANTYALLVSLLKAVQAVERTPGHEVNLSNLDESGGAMIANVDPLPYPVGYEGVRLNVAGAGLSIGGIEAPTSPEQRVVAVLNSGANPVTFTHEGAGTAANNVACPGNADYALPVNGLAILYYDTVASNWIFVNRL